MPLNYRCSTSLSKVASHNAAYSTGFTHLAPNPPILHPPYFSSLSFTLSLPSLSVPSIQRQKARLLLVCGQIRAAPARFWWEGARRRPVLQLWEPIGAERDGGREGGGVRSKKENCKQMETLRILGERSRDGSADKWMFAISICCLWDLFFWGRAEGNRGRSTRRKNKPVFTDTFLRWMDSS